MGSIWKNEYDDNCFSYSMMLCLKVKNHSQIVYMVKESHTVAQVVPIKSTLL